MSARRKPVVLAAILVALVAGAALAAVLGGEDEPGRPAGTGPGPRETGTTDRPPGSTAPTTEHTSAEPAPAASPRAEQAIEQAVADATASAEQGRPPPGIEPGDLPGSDELSIESVRAEGDHGTARLSSGAIVELRRAGARWRVVSVRAP